MSDIPVSENPKFSQVMEALTTQTPAHADVFNAIFSQFLNNDYYLSLLVERLSEKLAGHFADYVAHITADERTNWNSKANGTHTHNYAGSSLAGGAANSAVKLQTARTIKIGNQSNTFDGSKNIAFDEKSMGFLKIINLDVKTTTFLKISCEAQTNYNGALITPKYFFMIVDNYSSEMGGYYISSQALSIPNTNSIGQSAGVINIKAKKESNRGIFEISGGSASNGTLNIIYDAANVEVTQL